MVPSADNILEINRRVGGGIVNKGAIEFLLSKIESKRIEDDHKRSIAKISAMIWMDIIQHHPFIDGNKRTATEAMKLFLRKNGLRLNTSTAGMAYTSLKIANNEMHYEKLVEWIYDRLMKG